LSWQSLLPNCPFVYGGWLIGAQAQAYRAARKSCRSVKSKKLRREPAGAFAIRNRRLRRGLQGDRADTGRHVQALVAFQRKRLQGDGLVEAADQGIGADADADRGAGGAAGIGARQSAWPNVRAGRKHAPDQNAAFGVADIDAELVDRADIMLTRMSAGTVGAMQVFRRAEDESKPAGHVAGQVADLDAGRSGIGGGGKGKTGHGHSRANHQMK